ncbi:MAG: cell wall-binding protein [Lachnospiraceae bacterium]|nr:cell wall-binding protein [Lachnospiraceae bacterium]
MKKKGLKVLAAAAMLTMGMMTMSAYAAEGWSMSNNSWVYLDKNGTKVTDEWRKGADNLWRYLNSSGEMAINTWVDDDYYVDSNGIMVSNQWVWTRPLYGDDSEQYWFYFGSSGKVVKEGWKKIDGKSYLFDSDGIMETGWSEDELYYLGQDGAMKTGWRYIEPPTDEFNDEEDWYDDYDGEYSSDGKYWFYFASNGKKYCPQTGTDESADFRISRIDGKYYCFDEYGIMRTGWVYLNGDPDDAPVDSIENWRYFAGEEIQNATLGASIQGWLSLEPPERLQDNMDEPVVWYFFNKDGSPEVGPDYGTASTTDFTRINGNNYLFDPKGNPVSGLHEIEIGSTDEKTAYYFDEDSKTALKGKKTIEEGDGTKSTFYFNEGSYAGRGVTGVKDNYLYYKGKRQEADSDVRYTLISIPDGEDTYKTYAVNSSGRITKNKTVKDGDGVKYTTNSVGIVIEIDGEPINNNSSYGDPIEPVFEEWDY